MSLTEKDVRRIAHLARIGVSPEDVTKAEQDLNGIFAWIDQLQNVDVSHVQLHEGGHTPQMHERRDEVTRTEGNPLPTQHGFFEVPKIIE